MVHFQANQPAAAAAVAVAAASSSSSSAAPSAAAVSIHLCDEIGCSLPAIHHCDLCMWLCAHHDAENHAMLEKEELTQHTRTDAQLKWDRMKASKEKIEKKKQTVMQTEEKAKELKQPLIDMKKEFELLPKKIDDQSIALNEVGISAGECTRLTHSHPPHLIVGFNCSRRSCASHTRLFCFSRCVVCTDV